MRDNKGITLAVLVATAVILAILAFNVIGMINGEEGLFSRADKATKDFNNEVNNQTDMLTQIANGEYAPIKPKQIKYYIKFNANGGTGTMTNQEMIYGTSAKLPANSFTKVGSVFTGWNTADNGSGTWFADGQSVNDLTDTEGAEVNLYAQWGIRVKYAVQIYGINQDVDANNNTLGLTFGPATGDNYNNKYVTHRYEETSSGSGVYNVIIKTTTVAANNSETTSEEYLKDSSSNNVTRTQAQVTARQNINLHDMTWAQIAAVSDKTVFEDCMLCGDTKSVTINLNSTIASGNSYTQNGDGAGVIVNKINTYYRKWNPRSSDNSAVGTNVTLDSNEAKYGSNARNDGGYKTSHIRATLIGADVSNPTIGYAGNVNLSSSTCLYSCIESNLRDVITPKKIKYVTGTGTSNYSLNDDIADKIWLLSDREMYGTGQNSGNTTEGLGASGDGYDKFGNPESKYYISSYNTSKNDNRVVYFDAANSTADLWLRSPHLSNKYYVRFINVNGALDYNTATGERALGFGFCIR